jgi:hypothetical protein
MNQQEHLQNYMGLQMTRQYKLMLIKILAEAIANARYDPECANWSRDHMQQLIKKRKL